MSKAWIRSKMPEFVRDFFRDFCQSAKRLEEQFSLFDRKDRVDFEIIRDLMGVEMNKGLLWRLKDMAHHVFSNGEDSVGRFLDWGLGYVFHETMKLKEDAYQYQVYGPQFRNLQNRDLPPLQHEIGEELFKVLSQTRESMRREIDRIRFIMYHCRQLTPSFLAAHKDNLLLARFIFSRNDLVREVFGSQYDDLVNTVYEGEPELMYVMASRSLRQGGWVAQAAKAMEEACAINSRSEKVLEENKIVENWSKSFPAE